MSSPCVSIVMPVYNAEQYLHDAIESILNQTFTDFEFLIINDGSTDKSEEIILSYDDPRIRYIKNETNLQIVKTLNEGIGLARGKYIARMDADDISLPERFKKQIQFLEDNQDIDICGTWFKTFGEKEYLHKLPTRHERIKADLLFYTPITHPTVMMKKSIFDQYKYPENFPKAEDYALWTKLIGHYVFSNIPICLLKYRLHPKQTGIIESITQFNSTKLALNAFLQNLGITTVRETHYQIWQRKFVPLQEVEDWLKYLKSTNSRNEYFDASSLAETLFNQWWIMNNLQSNFNLRTLIDFYTSSLYIPGKLSFLEHLKFIIKALVFYKRAKT